MQRFFEDYMQRITDLHRGFEVVIKGLDTAQLDWVPGPAMNSLTVLVVHIAGAERYWIGDVALCDPSGRDRDAEFRAQGYTEDQLLARLAESSAYVRGALDRITMDDLGNECTSARHPDRTFTVGWALAHTLEHTAIHLGHAQVTRQILDMQAAH
ncbi:MAG: DinB family protein [Anaerolineales bacterium]